MKKEHGLAYIYIQSKYLYYFMILMILVTIIDLLANSLKSNLPFLRYFFALGSLFYLGNAIYYQRRNQTSLRKNTRFIIYLLLIWSFVMIMMGMPQVFSGYIRNTYVKILISGQLLLYLLPLILLVNPNIVFYKKMMKLSAFMAILYLFFTIPFISFFLKDIQNGAETYAAFFASCSTLVILTFPYHSKWTVRLMFLATFVAIALTGYFARRNQVLYFSSVLLFIGVITLMSRSTLLRKRRMVFLLSIITSLIFIFILANIFTLKYNPLFEKVGTGFESRESVFADFKADFDTKNDWWIGRGINGEYNSNTSVDEFKNTRPGIENGYYQYILKGGYIYLGLFVLISLLASFNGFFRSNNILSKAFAAIIIINLIDMIGFGIPTLSIRYVTLWFSIAGCLSPWLRSLNDEYLALNIGIR
jgi:hypothetical protein